MSHINTITVERLVTYTVMYVFLSITTLHRYDTKMQVAMNAEIESLRMQVWLKEKCHLLGST